MNSRVWRIAPLLFGSGFCALVYQTAWQRELRLIFGASTAASAAVLAIFMGGLGLGGALLGRRVDGDKRPLDFYARLELLIAVSAAVTPLLVGLARLVYVALGGSVSLGLVLGSGVRLVLSALVLAVPTLLMGGTLPAAARAAETPEDVRRRALAVLYGVNTLGAVAGAAASTFLFFEVFGTRLTLWMACLLNALVALVARSVARGLPEHEDASVSGSPEVNPSQQEAPPAHAFVLGAAALVGFAFFLMEMVWYRMLGPLLGGSTFTFGLILMVALAGIGLGGAAYAAWGQERPASLRGFALTCLVEALLLAVPLALGDTVAVVAGQVRALAVFGFGGLVVAWALIAGLVVLPAAFVSGVQFPLLLALLGRGGEGVGRQVGLAYAWNTVGCIVGSLAGGFGLLPLLTAPGVWRLVGAVLVALGLGAVGLSVRRERPQALWLTTTLASAVGALLLLLAPGPTAAWRHSAIGAGREHIPQDSRNDLRGWLDFKRRWVTWEADGVEVDVALAASDGLAFIVNGKTDGNTLRDAGTQVMSGLIGTLLHPQPRRSLVIGLGTGSTAGWMGAVPEMERVDVVEIEPAIVEVARRCASVNERVLDNPKVHLLFDDAREVLLASHDSYDVIFSEPSNPYRLGISSLFSRQFYQAVKQRLAPGGLFLQWLQGYEVDARTVRSVYATLTSEFGSVETWRTEEGDMLLVASEAPLHYDVERMRARLGQEPYRRALPSVWRTDEVEGVLANFLAGPAAARALAEGQEDAINTDDLSYVEFSFARSVGSDTQDVSSGQLRGLALEVGADRPLVEHGTVDWQRVEELRSLLENRIPTPRRADVDESALGKRRLVLDALRQEPQAKALRLWREGGWTPRGPGEALRVGELLASQGDDAVLPLIEKLAGQRPVDAELLRARLLRQQGRLSEAAQALERAYAFLHQQPWYTATLLRDAMPLSVELAQKEPAEGRKHWAQLATPFASYAAENLRAPLLVELARRLDFKGLCAQAFAAYEPYPLWSRAFLQQRAHCYTSTGNPLAARAEAELNAYLEDEPSVLWTASREASAPTTPLVEPKPGASAGTVSP